MLLLGQIWRVTRENFTQPLDDAFNFSIYSGCVFSAQARSIAAFFNNTAYHADLPSWQSQ
ncbi:hypothetical protein QP150_20100 [Sphingomonas sp. 22L2VL55-3]